MTRLVSWLAVFQSMFAEHGCTGELQDQKTTWIKGTDLRERVRGILGQTADQMGNAQWIRHILKRLQLVDNSRRKPHVSGKVYAIDRREVLDMMQRYNVPRIKNEIGK